MAVTPESTERVREALAQLRAAYGGNETTRASQIADARIVRDKALAALADGRLDFEDAGTAVKALLDASRREEEIETGRRGFPGDINVSVTLRGEEVGVADKILGRGESESRESRPRKRKRAA